MVFVEKPPCLNRSELRELLEAVRKTKGMLAVGFNRRYSPIARRARDLIGKRADPMIVNYRVNAGQAPADHWIHDPRVGGGRVVGECCHFFDFFAYLVRSKVTDINVTPLYSSGGELASDNFVSTLRWSDGSVTSLTYTSIGSPILPKERMEDYPLLLMTSNRFSRMAPMERALACGRTRGIERNLGNWPISQEV
jgi:predicted dehydrogenase